MGTQNILNEYISYLWRDKFFEETGASVYEFFYCEAEGENTFLDCPMGINLVSLNWIMMVQNTGKERISTLKINLPNPFFII